MVSEFDFKMYRKQYQRIIGATLEPFEEEKGYVAPVTFLPRGKGSGDVAEVGVEAARGDRRGAEPGSQEHGSMSASGWRPSATRGSPALAFYAQG
jgi:hypothetical protein